MDILQELEARRRQGKDVISFSLGEPDLEPAAEVQQACIQAIQEGFLKYTSTQGFEELRREIVLYYREKNGVTIDPDQVLVTEGTSPAMLLAFSVLLSPGDDIILSNPHYPCYPAFVQFLKGRPNLVSVKEADGFQYRPEAIRKKITPKTRAILINSPSNPAGTLLSEESLKAIADLAAKKRWIVSDEIYHELVYQGRERSILEFTDRAFVINGFSKAFSMTGYRLGYLIAPKPFVRTLQILHQNLYISANAFVQRAGLAALRHRGPYLEKVRKIYDERRRVMLEGVKKMGFEVVVEPTGAFYIFANAKKFTKDSYRFCKKILEKTDVGITPGIDFGSGGEGFVRFSYATSVAQIREGLRRIEDFLK